MKGLNIFPKPINLQPLEEKLEGMLSEIYNTEYNADERAAIKGCLDEIASLKRDVENWRKLLDVLRNNF